MRATRHASLQWQTFGLSGLTKCCQWLSQQADLGAADKAFLGVQSLNKEIDVNDTAFGIGVIFDQEQMPVQCHDARCQAGFQRQLGQPCKDCNQLGPLGRDDEAPLYTFTLWHPSQCSTWEVK